MTEAEEERARVVAWLRDSAAKFLGMIEPSYGLDTIAMLEEEAEAAERLADAIEAGDHLKGVE